MLDIQGAPMRAKVIIHAGATAAAAAAGVTVIPGSDAVVIVPIQIAMVAAVYREYDVRLSSALLKSTVYSSLAQMIGKGGSKALLRFIPGPGNLIRASVAFSVTEALGMLVLDQLESGEGLPGGHDDDLP